MGFIYGDLKSKSVLKWCCNGLVRRNITSLGTILIILLILALIGALPTWGYSSGWGYAPGGIIGLLLVVVIILALLGRI